jgi:hypothetical protein
MGHTALQGLADSRLEFGRAVVIEQAQQRRGVTSRVVLGILFRPI